MGTEVILFRATFNLLAARKWLRTAIFFFFTLFTLSFPKELNALLSVKTIQLYFIDFRDSFTQFKSSDLFHISLFSDYTDGCITKLDEERAFTGKKCSVALRWTIFKILSGTTRGCTNYCT